MSAKGDGSNVCQLTLTFSGRQAAREERLLADQPVDSMSKLKQIAAIE